MRSKAAQLLVIARLLGTNGCATPLSLSKNEIGQSLTKSSNRRLVLASHSLQTSDQLPRGTLALHRPDESLSPDRRRRSRER